MLYKKRSAKELDKELFKNPTCEYRGTPFWAWNCKLESDTIKEQVDIMKQMGFGGFHMHVRTGLDTPYMSDEYMGYIKECVEYAKDKDMLSWLYDEDRWPSGAAGGIVTKDEKYRQRYLLMTVKPTEGKLIACFDIELNADGSLKSYNKISENDIANGTKWYAYLKIEEESPWYNNQTYANTLDKATIEHFIEVTHEKYKETVGEHFGNSIPAIFTDEPQFSRKKTLPSADSTNDVKLPWTDDLPETFAKKYSDDLVSHIPELFWDLPDGEISLIRYRYHDHISDRFTEAFADTCGKWCEENGIALTGHMMEEPTLMSQTAALGEAMRSYRSFGLPGIDMLCAWFEFTTAKQAQSAVHQYGREGMLSELYGVTNWDFDFRGYKLHGDWQAALGVTIRVPHLSWMSMAGEAKRDYPASIFYQSPWYTEYSYIEDHFARVNTAMTRGEPVVKVAVIHPVESYWLHWGPSKETSLYREELENRFNSVTNWLLKGNIDFDFISESLLPSQCAKGDAPLKVGEMEYDVVIVPGCETLRSTTLSRLDEFVNAGGKLIFMGDAPEYIDAVKNDAAAKLAEKSTRISFSRGSLLSALDDNRIITLRKSNGFLTDNLMHQLRKDGDKLWLFVSHAKEPENKDLPRYDDVDICIRGEWVPTLYDTMDGEIYSLDYKYVNGETVIRQKMFEYDSILICLEIVAQTDKKVSRPDDVENYKEIKIPQRVDITLNEPNALLLDIAEFALDGEPFRAEEEILRLDDICRKEMNWPVRKNDVAQPWTIEKENIEHSVTLKFNIESEIEVKNAKLAIEDAERVNITFNGEKVKSDVNGWYVDKSIKTVDISTINKGNNILIVEIPFGKRTNIEWCYIIGDFGVRVCGREKVITEPVRSLTFSDISTQGLPFYGGTVTYHVPFESCGETVAVFTEKYRGGVVKVEIDGKTGYTALPPNAFETKLNKGKHIANITLYGNRNNSFGIVHCSDNKLSWVGPDGWRTVNAQWSYEYQLRPVGLLKAPVIGEK